ncbi:hypothetical protein GQ457_02G017190 [Hibiscus cannabinus]
MNKSIERVFLVWLIILFLSNEIVCQPSPKQSNEEKPSMLQLLSNTLWSLKSYWEKTKAIVHHFQLHFTPPTLDFRGTGTGTGPAEAAVAGEKVKAAVKDIIGTSEAVAKETAKSAAEAVHKTAEKIKGSAQQESRDEL